MVNCTSALGESESGLSCGPTLATPSERPCGGYMDTIGQSRAQRRRFRLRRTAVLKSKLASSYVSALVLGGLDEANAAPPQAIEHVCNKLDFLDQRISDLGSLVMGALQHPSVAWSPQGLVYFDDCRDAQSQSFLNPHAQEFCPSNDAPGFFAPRDEEAKAEVLVRKIPSRNAMPVDNSEISADNKSDSDDDDEDDDNPYANYARDKHPTSEEQIDELLPGLGFVTIADAGRCTAVSKLVSQATIPSIAALVEQNGGTTIYDDTPTTAQHHPDDSISKEGDAYIQRSSAADADHTRMERGKDSAMQVVNSEKPERSNSDDIDFDDDDGVTDFEGRKRMHLWEPLPSGESLTSREEANAPVGVLVGRTFKEVTQDPTVDVLTVFYAPWCGNCRNFEPLYKALAESLKHVPTLKFTKLDFTRNSRSYILLAESLKNVPAGCPTIVLYAAGESSPKRQVVYSGNTQPEHMTQWLHEHCSIKFDDDNRVDTTISI